MVRHRSHARLTQLKPATLQIVDCIGEVRAHFIADPLAITHSIAYIIVINTTQTGDHWQLAIGSRVLANTRSIIRPMPCVHNVLRPHVCGCVIAVCCPSPSAWIISHFIETLKMGFKCSVVILCILHTYKLVLYSKTCLKCEMFKSRQNKVCPLICRYWKAIVSQERPVYGFYHMYGFFFNFADFARL